MKLISFTSKINYKKRFKSLLIIVTVFFCNCGYAQPLTEKIKYSNRVSQENLNWYSKKFFTIYAKAAVIPTAKIVVIDGQYHLKPKPSLAFTGGFNYVFNFNAYWAIVSGLQLTITKYNLYNYIKQVDMPTVPRVNDNWPLIYVKDIHFHIAIPVSVVKRINVSESKFWSIKVGGTINYNGFNSDTRIGMGTQDVNGQGVSIFSSSFKFNNDYKPWVNFTSSVSKNYIFSNKNILGVEAGVEIGKSGYFYGDYVITIPSKPDSHGIYKSNGFSTGLTVSYTFTGTNKRLVKKYISNK